MSARDKLSANSDMDVEVQVQGSNGGPGNLPVQFSPDVSIDIWLDILSFANLDTIKAFSLSSKAYCDIARPVLFSKLKLSKESLDSFKRGALSGLRSKIRHITLQYPEISGERADEVLDAYDLLQTYAESLHLFSGLTSLKIPFGGSADDAFQSAFLSGVFQKISEHSQHIKILKIDYKLKEAAVCSVLSREREGEERLIEREKARAKVLSPLVGVEDLTLTVNWDADFSNESAFWGQNHGAIFWSSSQTLRKLSLTLGSMKNYNDPGIVGLWSLDLVAVKVVFPVLEDVSIVVNAKIYTWTLEIFVRMFPNVRYFSVDAPALRGSCRMFGPLNPSNPRRILYQELARLKRLKKASIIWPHMHIRDSDNYRLVEVKQVEASVRVLMEEGSKELECVEFTKRSEKTMQMWRSNSSIRYDGDLVVFKVLRVDDEVELRREEYLTDWWRLFSETIQGCADWINTDADEFQRLVEERRKQILGGYRTRTHLNFGL